MTIRTIALLSLAIAAPLVAEAAETLRVTQKATLTLERGTVGLRPGHELLLIDREGDTLKVMFRSMEGSIALADTNFREGVPFRSTVGVLKLEQKEPAIPAMAAHGDTPGAAKQKEPDAQTAPREPAHRIVIDQPSSTYGKMVKKAEGVAEAHDQAHADGVAEVLE